jgi:hypothetical protein
VSSAVEPVLKGVAAALPRVAVVLLAALQGRVPAVQEAQAAAEVPVAAVLAVANPPLLCDGEAALTGGLFLPYHPSEPTSSLCKFVDGEHDQFAPAAPQWKPFPAAAKKGPAFRYHVRHMLVSENVVMLTSPGSHRSRRASRCHRALIPISPSPRWRCMFGFDAAHSAKVTSLREQGIFSSNTCRRVGFLDNPSLSGRTLWSRARAR